MLRQTESCEVCGSKEVYLYILGSIIGGIKHYHSLCYDCMIKKEPKLADVCICGHLRDMHRHGDWLCSPDQTSEAHSHIKLLETENGTMFFTCKKNCSKFVLDKKVKPPTTFNELYKLIFKPMFDRNEGFAMKSPKLILKRE